MWLELKQKPNKRNISKFGINELQDLNKIDKLLKGVDSQYKSNNIEEMPPSFTYKEKQFPLSQVSLSDHGMKRARERLNWGNKSHIEIEGLLKKELSTAEYVGQISSSDGNVSEMFVKGSVSIHLSPDLKNIITVITYDKLPYSPVNSKLKQLLHKEFRKLNRSESARHRRLELFRLEAKSEISELKLRAFKTRSESVRLACEGRVKSLSDRLFELENELIDIRNHKRQIAYQYVRI